MNPLVSIPCLAFGAFALGKYVWKRATAPAKEEEPFWAANDPGEAGELYRQLGVTKVVKDPKKGYIIHCAREPTQHERLDVEYSFFLPTHSFEW